MVQVSIYDPAMPSAVSELLRVAGCELSGVVRWHERVALNAPGVYLVARTSDPDGVVDEAQPANIALEAVTQLLMTRPELQVDGRRATARELSDRIASFWLADEPVVYVGLAKKSVRNRVRAYYRTPLGARQPHAGGWFLKVLAEVNELHVHFALANDPDQAESDILRSFCAGVSDPTRSGLHDPERPFPFANLEWPRGTRKRHGITGARQPKTTAS